MAAFTPIDVVAELTNIGTLSAFVLVAIGVLVPRRTQPTLRRAFHVPFVPVLPILSRPFSLVLIVSLPGITIIRFVGGEPVEFAARPLPPAHSNDTEAPDYMEEPPARVS